MQSAAIGEYIRNSSGVKGKVTGLSPDGTIAAVFNLGTGKTENWVLSLCSADIDYGARPAQTIHTVQLVRVAKGPIVGAILIANLITGVIGFIVLLLTGMIH